MELHKSNNDWIAFFGWIIPLRQWFSIFDLQAPTLRNSIQKKSHFYT